MDILIFPGGNIITYIDLPIFVQLSLSTFVDSL